MIKFIKRLCTSVITAGIWLTIGYHGSLYINTLQPILIQSDLPSYTFSVKNKTSNSTITVVIDRVSGECLWRQREVFIHYVGGILHSTQSVFNNATDVVDLGSKSPGFAGAVFLAAEKCGLVITSISFHIQSTGYYDTFFFDNVPDLK